MSKKVNRTAILSLSTNLKIFFKQTSNKISRSKTRFHKPVSTITRKKDN